jgi:lipoate-protein ligase A
MPIFAKLEICKDATPRSAAVNMAIDEALLEATKVPSIRFYQWKSPALSFGYFGRFTDVADYAAERDLVRRWTGGGIVFHGDDLTYSILIPASDPAFSESSMSIYEKIHCALRDALVSAGQNAVVAAVPNRESLRGHARGDNPPCCSHTPVARPTAHWSACDDGPQGRGYNPHLCFANPVSADVIMNGRKVAGAAQRRTRAGLLHQGSIQLATERVRVAAATGHVNLGNGLAERFAKELSEARSEKSLSTSFIERAKEIAEQKYGTQSWLQRH